MATISFKADDKLNKNLKALAQKKGITTSAYIKLILTKGMNGDLIEMTENGLTVAEELEIIDSDKNDKVYGPFTKAKSLMAALKK
jgi:antitoxin component of RelBE/YafQ-DinJ toxin-antitoxin module